MSVKTFTSTTLSSSDVNTYLANSGLVYVTSVAASGTSVTITNCFSSTYDNYRIVFSDMLNNTAASNLNIQIRTASTTIATGYYDIVLDAQGTAISSNQINNGTSARTQIIVDTANKSGGILEIMNPNKPQVTSFMGDGVDTRTIGSFFRLSRSFVTGTDVAVSLVISNSVSFASGLITVYGYRKA